MSKTNRSKPKLLPRTWAKKVSVAASHKKPLYGDRQIFAKVNYAVCCRLFPDTDHAIDALIDSVPQAIIPLLVGMDLPDWLTGKIQARLKRE